MSPSPDTQDTEELTPANRDCLLKAKPGEPMFIILGRDPDGGNIVRLWAQRRFNGGDTEHAGPVFAIADAMDAWRAAGNLPESAPDAESYPPITDRPDSPVTVMREALEYHAEQLSTYLAQPTISEKHLASARYHNDKIRELARISLGTPHAASA